MSVIKQSEATAGNRWVCFQAFDDDAADNFAPKTGLTFSAGELKVCKAGGAWADAANHATVVEIGGGWYWYQFSQTECNTLGPLMLILNKTDVYADAVEAQVVAYDPNSATNLGLSNIDGAVSGGAAAAVVSALLAETIDGQTVEKILAIAGAVGGARRSISGSTFILRDLANTKNLVTATVDGVGNVTGTTIV